jgi:hypothetical protein
MIRTPEDYLHPSGKKARQYQRSFTKTGILTFFSHYCFACSNFGHKSINCRAYRKKNLKVKNYILKDKQATNRVKRRNYNSFEPLQKGDLKCLRCHNHGHKDINCRLMEVSEHPKFIREQKKLWRVKTSKSECLISLKTQDEKDLWYVDSGCSKHMAGNKAKFLELKKQKGKVTFGYNASSNILRNGTVSLGKDKARNVLLVDKLNPSLLSVSQTCNQ